MSSDSRRQMINWSDPEVQDRLRHTSDGQRAVFHHARAMTAPRGSRERRANRRIAERLAAKALRLGRRDG